MSAVISARLSLEGAAQLLKQELDEEMQRLQARRDELTAEIAEISTDLQTLAARRQEVAQYLSGKGKP